MRRKIPAPEERSAERLEEKPFLDHLEDLRRTLIKALLVFGGAFLLAVPLTVRGYTLRVLKRPLVIALSRIGGSEAGSAALPTLSPAGGFSVAMKVSLGCALVISFPLMLYFAGSFVLPALTRRERRYFTPTLAGGTALFYAGMALCYLVTLPWAIQFFWKFNALMGIGNLWTINEYTKFAARLLIAFGVIFELPMVVLFLVKIGVVDYRMLRSARRYAILCIFVVAAILTPPDAVTQVMMAIPLLILYEICVWGAKFIGKSGEGRVTGDE